MKTIEQIKEDLDKLVISHCPRCIEDWEDLQGGAPTTIKGEKKQSACSHCLVCEDCEHLMGCKNSK